MKKSNVFQTVKDLNDLRKVILSTNSKTMTVQFIKKNGELRTMLCKIGVKKFLSRKPNKRKKTPNPEVINVLDMESKTYKSFRLDSVVDFKCGKVQGEF